MDEATVRQIVRDELNRAPPRNRLPWPLDIDSIFTLEKAGFTRGYAGQVASDGTATILPPGWTSAKTGTGQYTVTHNLGHTHYGVAGISVDANLATINLAEAPSANTFKVITWNNTPTNTDLPWAFVLTPTV